MTNQAPTSRVAQLEAALAEISRENQRLQAELKTMTAMWEGLRWKIDQQRAEIATLNRELTEELRTSEARRDTLFEVRAQQIEDWKRAENAEAQVATLEQALEEAQYQPEFWAVLRIVARELDEAQAENARLLAFHQQRMRDEIKRADAAERQIAAVRAYCPKLRELADALWLLGLKDQGLKDQATTLHAIAHHIEAALLPASPTPTKEPR